PLVEVEKFKILGKEEADPVKKKISFESPLGKSLLNKFKGAVLKVNTPQGKIKYKILKIE
ncbi:MAG: transcription elongation factor GreA, partial [Parcubacteria group bacterium CG_4_9_14_0_2_um_filter_35_11]